jgi:hypothetical protein
MFSEHEKQTVRELYTALNADERWFGCARTRRHCWLGAQLALFLADTMFALARHG